MRCFLFLFVFHVVNAYAALSPADCIRIAELTAKLPTTQELFMGEVRQAIQAVADFDATPEAKAQLWERVAQNFESRARPKWRSKQIKLANGNIIFWGREGQILQIRPDGGVYRGGAHELTELTQGVKLLPEYQALSADHKQNYFKSFFDLPEAFQNQFIELVDQQLAQRNEYRKVLPTPKTLMPNPMASSSEHELHAAGTLIPNNPLGFKLAFPEQRPGTYLFLGMRDGSLAVTEQTPDPTVGESQPYLATHRSLIGFLFKHAGVYPDVVYAGQFVLSRVETPHGSQTVVSELANRTNTFRTSNDITHLAFAEQMLRSRGVDIVTEGARRTRQIDYSVGEHPDAHIGAEEAAALQVYAQVVPQGSTLLGELENAYAQMRGVFPDSHLGRLDQATAAISAKKFYVEVEHAQYAAFKKQNAAHLADPEVETQLKRLQKASDLARFISATINQMADGNQEAIVAWKDIMNKPTERQATGGIINIQNPDGQPKYRAEEFAPAFRKWLEWERTQRSPVSSP